MYTCCVREILERVAFLSKRGSNLHSTDRWCCRRHLFFSRSCQDWHLLSGTSRFSYSIFVTLCIGNFFILTDTLVLLLHVCLQLNSQTGIEVSLSFLKGMILRVFLNCPRDTLPVTLYTKRRTFLSHWRRYRSWEHSSYTKVEGVSKETFTVSSFSFSIHAFFVPVLLFFTVLQYTCLRSNNLSRESSCCHSSSCDVQLFSGLPIDRLECR